MPGGPGGGRVSRGQASGALLGIMLRIFFEASKINQNGRINQLTSAQGPFFDKKTRLLASLLASFFRFFRKLRKCVISEEYSAKRGSEPSKTFDYRFDFSLNLHVFPNPLLESIFGGSRCRPMLNGAILSAFCDPG